MRARISLASEDERKIGDDMFAGRGRPALMSTKEPAIRLLNEKYSESFAVTSGARKNQVHLFLIKLGMWALVWTFTSSDLPVDSTHGIPTSQVLQLIESALTGKDPKMKEKLDRAVSLALLRVKKMAEELKLSR